MCQSEPRLLRWGFVPPHHLSLSSSNCKARKQQSHRSKYSQSLNHVLEMYPSPSPNPQGFPHSSVGKESACNAGDSGSIPGLGRSAGERIGYPLQYSWASLVAQLVKNPLAMQETWVESLGWEDLEKGKLLTPVFQNSMDCIVHGVAKSPTQLSDFHFHAILFYHEILKFSKEFPYCSA